jgi:hypothetical protein
MLDVQPPPDVPGIIQHLAKQFSAAMAVLLTTIDATVVDLARLAYVSVLLVGALLYFTHLEKRLGKDLIKGGVVLAVLAELVFPFVVKI